MSRKRSDSWLDLIYETNHEKRLLMRLKSLKEDIFENSSLVKSYLEKGSALGENLQLVVRDLEECLTRKERVVQALAIEELPPLSLSLPHPVLRPTAKSSPISIDPLIEQKLVTREMSNASSPAPGEEHSPVTKRTGPSVQPKGEVSLPALGPKVSEKLSRAVSSSPPTCLSPILSADYCSAASSLNSSYLCAIHADADHFLYKGYSNGLVIREHLQNQKEIAVFASRPERVEVLYVDYEEGVLWAGFCDGTVRCFELGSTALLKEYKDMKGKIVNIEAGWGQFVILSSFSGSVMVVENKKVESMESFKLDCDKIIATHVIGKHKSQLLVLAEGRLPFLFDLFSGNFVTTVGSNVISKPAFAKSWENYCCLSTTRRAENKCSSTLNVYETSSNGGVFQRLHELEDEGLVVALNADQDNLIAVVKLSIDTRLHCYSFAGGDFVLKWISFVPFDGLVCGVSVLPFGIALTAHSDGNVYQTIFNINGPFNCSRCKLPFCRMNDLKQHFASCSRHASFGSY